MRAKMSVLLATTTVFLVGLSAFADPLKVALILDRGGKDDKSFNSAAFRGANEAKQKLGIYLKEIEAADDTLFEPAMRSFAQKKFNLIIGIGVAQAEAIKKISKEFPDQKFTLIDAPVAGANIKSAIFAEHQGSYLMGYIAAMKSKTGKIGFVGGMDIPLIRRFEKAYAQGAKAYRKNIQIFVNYVGVTGEAWNNPTKAKEIANSQYQRGADIIFAAAGASNAGVFDASDHDGYFAIGVDSNQNYIKPGHILTSMLKRVDTAVFESIQSMAKNNFTGGIQVFDFKNSGIDWALDDFNKSLFTKTELESINKIKAQLASGKIAVIDYYKEKH